MKSARKTRLAVRNNHLTLLDRYGNPIDSKPATRAAMNGHAYTGVNTGRLLNDLPVVDYAAPDAVILGAETLRARARHLERNNDIIRRALYLVEQNVVGPGGVQLVSKAKSRGGRANDQSAVQLIQGEWKRFERSRDIRCRFQSWRHALKMVTRRRVVDGEVFVELVPGFENRTRFSFRIVEPSAVPMGLNVEAQRIMMGIEYDPDWCPVAYYVADKSGPYSFHAMGGTFRRVPSERMLHFFAPERPHQGRGVTLLASPMQRLHMLNQYEEATLTGARIASSKMGFFYDDPNDLAPTSYTGSEADDEEAPIDPETGRPFEQEALIDIAAGQFEDIGSKKFTPFDPGYPPARYDEYTTSVLRSISAGLNISYYKLGNDLREVNYSTAREAKLDDCDAWRDQQSQLQDGILDPLFSEWLKIQILRPEFARFSTEDLPRLYPREWRFRGWGWVDPEKEGSAAERDVKMGWRSPSQIVAERGGNYEEVIDQIALDFEYAKSRGVDLKAALFGVQPQPQETEEPTNE